MSEIGLSGLLQESRNSKLVHGLAVVASIAATAMSGIVRSPNALASASTDSYCQDFQEADRVKTVCTYPDGTVVVSYDVMVDQPEDESTNNSDQNTSPAVQSDNQTNTREGVVSLLPLPSRQNPRRYWATKILNESRRGKNGRISLSPAARRNLQQARHNKCSPVEQVPRACVKLSGVLLETLFEVAEDARFRITHFTTGPHVPCSDHFQGRAADLLRFDGSRPTIKDRSILQMFLRKKPNYMGSQVLGPGDDANHSGKNAHLHVALAGSNPICRR